MKDLKTIVIIFFLLGLNSCQKDNSKKVKRDVFISPVFYTKKENQGLNNSSHPINSPHFKSYLKFIFETENIKHDFYDNFELETESLCRLGKQEWLFKKNWNFQEEYSVQFFFNPHIIPFLAHSVPCILTLRPFHKKKILGELSYETTLSL